MPLSNLAQPGAGQMANRHDVEVTCAAQLVVNPLVLQCSPFMLVLMWGAGQPDRPGKAIDRALCR